MTKEEFFLKTVIAMAGNPKYVDDGSLEGGRIIDEAMALADTIEEMDREVLGGTKGTMFDSPGEGPLAVISDSLYEISEVMKVRTV